MLKGLVTLIVFWFAFVGYTQTPTVSSLKLQGNERTKSSFIEKIIKLERGAVLDSSKIEEDMYRLKRLPSISHAYYQVFPSTIENQYDVVYGIEENFTLIPFASIFTSNDDEFAFRLGLQEFNVLGRNITLGGFYQRDIFDSFGAHVRAPNIFGRKWGLALSYQDLTTEEPVFWIMAAQIIATIMNPLKHWFSFNLALKIDLNLASTFSQRIISFYPGIWTPMYLWHFA